MPDARTPKLPPEAIAALERGQLIQAIKIIREQTGLGLAEAKQLAEQLKAWKMAQQAASSAGGGPKTDADPASFQSPVLAQTTLDPARLADGLAPGEVPRSRLPWTAIVIVLAIAALAAWMVVRR